VPGETVRFFVGWHSGCGFLVGGVRLQRFRHRSVARDTVRMHVVYSRAGAGRFGLFSVIFVMRISTPDKAGGLVRPRPPALHRLAGGQLGPDGKYLFCNLFWHMRKWSLQSCGFILDPEWGPLFGTVFGPPFWAPVVRKRLRRLNKWGHFLVQFLGLVFGRLLACGD